MNDNKNQLHIIICEDNLKERDALISIIHSSGMSCECTIFSSGEELLQYYLPGKWDLIIMDIMMKGLSGIETIQSIRALDDVIPVAFVTSSKEYALECYRLEAFRYIEKPATHAAVVKILQYAFISKNSKPQLLSTSGTKICSLDSILYLEQVGHNVIIYLSNNETIRIHEKLDQLEQQLMNDSFFRCHKSYLVNLSYIKSFDKDLSVFVMSNQNNVYIRRESLSNAKLTYENYLFQRTRKDYL